jgi:hypothetical protein
VAPDPHRRCGIIRPASGERSLAEVLDAVSDVEARLAQMGDSTAIAEQPDWRWVDDWLAQPQLPELLGPRPLTRETTGGYGNRRLVTLTELM